MTEMGLVSNRGKEIIFLFGLVSSSFEINFRGHLDFAYGKAVNTTILLVRKMPNIVGPRCSRKLYSGIYAASVCEETEEGKLTA